MRTSFAAKRADGFGVIRPAGTGRYRYLNFGPGVNKSPIDNADMLYLMPFVSYGLSVTRVGITIIDTATAGTVVRIVFYTPDPVLQVPKTLLLDAGTVAATSTGDKEITLGATLVVPDGLNYAGAVAQNCGADMPGWQGLFQFSSPYVADTAIGGFTEFCAFRTGGVTGAAPATYSGFSRSSDAPAIFVKEA